MRVALATKLVLLASFTALLVLPPVAGAVLPGANGRIAYISGRGGTDAEAKLYLRIASGSFGLGLNSGPFTGGTQQHRHPTWSPDRTKIAFARGDASCNPTKCDIYVIDLTAPFPFAENVTNTPKVNEDRPAWSPDGTRIAYESEVKEASGQVDILVDPIGTGATLNLTNTEAVIEGKPAWTPDSAEIYYHTGDPTKENTFDIVKEPSEGGTVTKIAASPAENEFQPSISPDGKRMCFTRGTKTGFNGTADVVVALTNGGGQQVLTLDNIGEEAKHGDYNCTWSPDGVFVAYVRGTFSNGDLVMERADGSDVIPIEIEAAKGVFDGNPDWAPDGRPVCKDVTVSTGFNQSVEIPLECLDSGPFYERSPVQEFASKNAANGEVDPVSQGDQEPSTVFYRPNPGFSGADTFTYGAFDQVAGFGESKTVTVNVAAPPQQAVDKPPVVSNVTVTPRKWELGSQLPKASVAVGAKVRWQLSEAASTKLIFQRALKGRRVGKRCVKETAANATKPSCKRFQNAGSLTRNGKAGANSLSFQGRLTTSRTLTPGSYRVSAQARDSAGQLSKTSFSSLFQVLSGD